MKTNILIAMIAMAISGTLNAAQASQQKLARLGFKVKLSNRKLRE